MTRQCDALSGPTSLFQREYLVEPRTLNVGPHAFLHSKHASLACGMLCADDLVYTTSGVVCKMINFWAASGAEAIVVRVATYARSPAGQDRWVTSAPIMATVGTDEVVDAVMWSPAARGEVRVIPPFQASAVRV